MFTTKKFYNKYMKKKFKLVKINKDNINMATEFQLSIFPEECGYGSYMLSIKLDNDYFSYYLAYDNENLIGITGIYSFDNIEETKSLWLGWFGISPMYRRKGYGKALLEQTIDMVKEYAKNDTRIKYFRLYTSSRDNPIACQMYREVMDIEEKYECDGDFNYDGTCLIFTKCLYNDGENPLWNNKSLNLSGITELENIKPE